MIKILLIMLCVFGAIAAFQAFAPHYVSKEAFQALGHSITYGFLVLVAALVLSVKTIA